MLHWVALLMAFSSHARADDTVQVRPQGAEAPVGSYHQPEWTAGRPFTNSRVFVKPEGTVEVEAWGKFQTYNDPINNVDLYQQEIEFGLGHRLQLDGYVNEIYQYNGGHEKKTYDLEGYQIELRYALADWGQIPLNPTLYLEYHPVKNNPERLEFRVLLGEEFASNWNFAANIGYETDLWGLKADDLPEREIPTTLGINNTGLCDKMAFGVEVKDVWSDVRSQRNHWFREIDVGPSVQWKPVPKFYLTVAPLFGMTHDSPKTETWVNMGYEL